MATAEDNNNQQMINNCNQRILTILLTQLYRRTLVLLDVQSVQ